MRSRMTRKSHLGHHATGLAPTGGLIRKTIVEANRPVRRTAHRPSQKRLNRTLQHVVARQADGVPVAFGFQVLVQLRSGEGGVTYYRDAQNVHHVPKRPLDEIILDL